MDPNQPINPPVGGQTPGETISPTYQDATAPPAFQPPPSAPPPAGGPPSYTPAPAYPPAGGPPPVPQPTVPPVPPVGGPASGPRVPSKSIANSTQNALMIAEIRDGIVIMNDGGFRSVIMAQSINFDLMSPEEREAVEFGYQGFLNSLYFDIQIFMRSSRVDLRPYIQKLDKIRMEHDNMLLALMMEDYIQFIDVLSQETNIMDKRFYIVVPYYQVASAQIAIKQGKKLFGNLFSAFSQNKARQVITINEADLETAKTELKNRVQAVLSGLQQVGVRAVPLDTEELIELYYDAYNPDTATRQQIRNMNDLTAPMIEKGEGQAVDPSLNREIQ